MFDGIRNALKSYGFFAGSYSHFIPSRDMPDQTGRVFVVTGGNVGMGYEMCRLLLEKNASVIFTARTQDKADATLQSLNKSHSGTGSVSSVVMDLGKLQSVVDAAAQILNAQKRLDVLINSAGVFGVPKGSTTQDGLEEHFAVNCIGHELFTRSLLPLLKETAKKETAGSVRLVHVASSASHMAAPKQGIDFGSLKSANKSYSPMTLYGQSKLGNVLVSNAFARQLEGTGIISVSLHPGNIETSLQRHQNGLQGFLISLLLWPTEYGTYTPLYAATSPEVTSHDSYYVPWAEKMDCPSKWAYDVAMQDKLMAFCDEQVRLKTDYRAAAQ